MSHLKLLKEQTAGDDDTIPNREDEVPDSRSSQWETALYAATNLESWETDEPHHYARDVHVAGTCFAGSIRTTTPGSGTRWSLPRRLRARDVSPPGRSRRCAPGSTSFMPGPWRTWEKRRSVLPSGCSIPRPMRRRGSIRSMVNRPTRLLHRRVRPRPSRPYLFPEDGEWVFTQPVWPSAVPKIDAIRDQARSLGWREAQLYQNRGRFRFPCGPNGLVCYLEDDKRIGAVTRQSIEIVGPPPQKNRLRFYNPNADHPPWLKKKTSGP